MKNIVFLFSLFLVAASCKPEKNAFVIEGEIQGLTETPIYLIHPEESGGMYDSVEVKNGKFRIKGTVEQPNLYMLSLGEGFMPLGVFLEPGIFKINGNLEELEDIRIEGGVLQNDYNKFLDLMKPISQTYGEIANELVAAKHEEDQEQIDLINEKIDLIKGQYYDTAYDFVEARPVDMLSAMLISDVLISKPDVKRLQQIVNQFDDNVKKSSYGQKVTTTLAVVAKTAIGIEAPVFTLNDDDEQPFELESLRGKYVLIDFWASWCMPCRNENPRLVKVYEEFRGPEFEILGVSIDHKPDNWREAIEKDGLTWKQVLDEKDISSEDYGVVAIPTNILLDPDGIIIGRNLFGKELTDKLNEVLG